MTAESSNDPIEREVQRRLDELSANDWALRRYDRNKDGKLDEDEWNVVVSLVRRQVQQEFSELKRDSGHQPSEPAESVVVDFDNLSEPEDWGVDTDPNIDMTARERLGERYDVLHELGTGAQADTFLGRDLHTNQFVAIKELAIERLDDWKSLELFEREARVLRQLDHPSIPAFIESLEIDDGGEKRLFLIQEFVDGDTLASEIEKQGTFESADIFNLARQLLEVLRYLQSLSPPIIHRDIKPSNIIRRRDGRLMLVDFGGVQSKMSTQQVGGSTVVGTSGYMPPEQLMGRANATTDLYGLGATLVHLATGHHPSMIPEERARLQWREYAALDERLEQFIDSLLEPIWEDRPQGAADALEALDNALSDAPTTSNALVNADSGGLVRQRPKDSFVSVERDPRHITIRIPPKFVRLDWNAVGIGAVITAVALAFHFTTGMLWLLGVALFGGTIVAGSLAFTHRATVITGNHSGWSTRVVRAGFFSDEDWHNTPIVAARLPEPGEVLPSRCDLLIHDTTWRGVDTGLRPDEVSWLAYEINRWVEELGPQSSRVFRERL